METVTVKDVDRKDNGWIEVEFEDGRKASTKDKALGDAAFAARGNEIEVELNTVQSGKFTNTYLNAIEGVESKPRSNGSSAGRKPTGGRGRSPEETKSIEAQWAYGRAVELLSMSTTDYTFPLDAATLKALDEQAAVLLANKSKLAKS